MYFLGEKRENSRASVCKGMKGEGAALPFACSPRTAFTLSTFQTTRLASWKLSQAAIMFMNACYFSKQSNSHETVIKRESNWPMYTWRSVHKTHSLKGTIWVTIWTLGKFVSLYMMFSNFNISVMFIKYWSSSLAGVLSHAYNICLFDFF